jgi:hypothetical protein
MAVGALLPDNYLSISHLDAGFQFWQLPCTPETISDSMAPTLNETSALGRSAPVFTYSKSGPRTVQISLRFHRDMMDALNAGTSNIVLKLGEDYVDSLIKALQAIAVPKYNLSNKAVEPPLVALRLSQEVFIKGVVTSAIGLEYALPILSNGKYAQVSVSFTVSEVDPYDATTVFQNGSFRGVVKTLKTGMNITD